MWSRVPAPARAAVGGLAGAAGWFALQPVLAVMPPAVRFFTGWILFTFGPGLAITAPLTRGDDRLRQTVLALGVGAAASAAIADVLGRLHLAAWFPVSTFACGGAAAAVWRRPSARKIERADIAAATAIVAIALLTGGIAYAHRTAEDRGGLQLYGDYDSLDLAYYASITSEATHTIPPTAPYYAGRGLNYAYYPQLVPAMLHRFLAVPVTGMYFGYLWPSLLALAGLTGYVFVRTLAPPVAAFVSMAWLMVGGDFSYLAAWALPHANVDWDYVLWPTNFLSPTMEVLHFNSWTPSLPLFFGVLTAGTEAVRRSSLGWAVLGGLLLAVLFQFKPFAFLVLAGALTAAAAAAWLFSTHRRVVRPYVTILGIGAICALPFAWRAFALYADRRSELRIDFFLLPQRMLIKLDLADTFHAMAARVLPESLTRPVVVAAATVVFLIIGPALRWIGVPALVRALTGTRSADAAGDPWRLLAWVALVGIATPFVLVTEPYHDTLQFYQAGLYALWVFAGTSLVAWARPRGRAGTAIAIAAVAMTLPSSVHYLARKWRDDGRPPLTVLDAPARLAADYLRGRDPQTTVVLHDRPLEPSLLPVVAGRRVVLAWARYAVGSEERLADVEAFYASADGDPDRALALLQRYRVSHVIVRARRDRVHPAVLARLLPVLRADDLTLYAVPAGLP
ncbi:MAG: hypothetical protein IT184_00800 [Acidobacteria bacterium]|nr:hypothetical protein [Acidobacteriota bacterium]